MRPSDRRDATMHHTGEARPLVIRLMSGDITRVRASLIVVNHFNGLPPSGAEAAIDEALGGVISLRAARGALDMHFGATTFFPAVNSNLAATAVLVVGLGDPGRFSEGRLPEVGAAIVQAVAETGFREVATVVHGAGSANVGPGKAAHRLVEGLLDAMTHVPGADCLREVMIVEHLGPKPNARARERMDLIAQGIREASGPARIHCFFERAPDLIGPAFSPPAASKPESRLTLIPEHLQLGIRTENRKLRLTLTGHGSLDCEDDYPYRAELIATIQKRLREEVLDAVGDGEARGRSLQGIGTQLFEAFFLHEFAKGQLRDPEARTKILVLGVNALNSDLPWELLHDGTGFLARQGIVSRVLGTKQAGRAAPASARDSVLRMLVVSDPTGTLPAAAREADLLFKQLQNRASLKIEHARGTQATYDRVSSLLDAAPCDILHYAGHFDFDAMRVGTSGLVLKDAMLTADDLATRRWAPRFFFCNSCESARVSDGSPADPTALPFSQQSLAEGLLRQGVQAFLGSLWNVNDRAAGTFALAFYRGVFGKMSLGEAVRRARNEVAKKHGNRQLAWAGYALFGPPWISLAARP
jgi:CHAT domain/Cytosol aminopeptidase family, N-terminal domain